jgi:hypothetical protein
MQIIPAAIAAMVGRYLGDVSVDRCETNWATDHRAILPSFGTVLAVDVMWAAAASSMEMTLRARVEVVKSLWRTRVDVRRRKDMLMVVDVGCRCMSRVIEVFLECGRLWSAYIFVGVV